ncbi:endonuclease/exonuclease/phosphatase family protein [Flavobacterium sp. RHBU_3]|uniref:endonuclease/exonuclease/phosphatase family protein n=1 Tax=Flavobacterium sp. RHBU_3 TaxID=3391184 RepID=UPI003984BD8C
MKIATLNIDWARKLKRHKTEQFFSGFDFDILVITEGIDLNLPGYPYKCLCEPIPENTLYEGLNYTEYLEGETAYRTVIYSKYPYTKRFEVRDNRTSLALEFETDSGSNVIYASIVGTQFRKKPYVQTELDNLITDCQRIYDKNQNLIIVGDLNTSFRENEKQYCINSAATHVLTALFDSLGLYVPTNALEQNIDHIVIPKVFVNKVVECVVFVEKDVASDHKGISLILLNCNTYKVLKTLQESPQI